MGLLRRRLEIMGWSSRADAAPRGHPVRWIILRREASLYTARSVSGISKGLLGNWRAPRTRQPGSRSRIGAIRRLRGVKISSTVASSGLGREQQPGRFSSARTRRLAMRHRPFLSAKRDNLWPEAPPPALELGLRSDIPLRASSQPPVPSRSGPCGPCALERARDVPKIQARVRSCTFRRLFRLTVPPASAVGAIPATVPRPKGAVTGTPGVR